MAAVFLIAALLLSLPLVSCLSLSNRKNPSERALSRNALRGFVISYTHSVNKGRVHDYYQCKDGMLVLQKTHFVSYGAGIPEADETEGAVFETTNDGYVISNLNRRLDKLVLAVGVIAEHAISLCSDADMQDNEVLLRTLFAPQTSLIVEIKKVPLPVYLFSRHI